MANEGQVLATQLEQPKSPIGIFELPCGYLDEAGNLYTEVEIREMTGDDEDMLGSKQVKDEKKMDELLCRCVKRIGTISESLKIRQVIPKLLGTDRTFLIFALRRVSLGDAFSFDFKCPNERCGVTNNYTVNLAELEIRKMVDPRKRIYDTVLPSGMKVRFRMLTGEDDATVSKLRENPDGLSQLMLLRVSQINEQPPTLADLKQMNTRSRNALRQAFDAVGGGIDTTVEIACPKCQTEFKVEADPAQPSFFFPPAPKT